MNDDLLDAIEIVIPKGSALFDKVQSHVFENRPSLRIGWLVFIVTMYREEDDCAVAEIMSADGYKFSAKAIAKLVEGQS